MKHACIMDGQTLTHPSCCYEQLQYVIYYTAKAIHLLPASLKQHVDKRTFESIHVMEEVNVPLEHFQHAPLQVRGAGCKILHNTRKYQPNVVKNQSESVIYSKWPLSEYIIGLLHVGAD